MMYYGDFNFNFPDFLWDWSFHKFISYLNFLFLWSACSRLLFIFFLDCLSFLTNFLRHSLHILGKSFIWLYILQILSLWLSVLLSLRCLLIRRNSWFRENYFALLFFPFLASAFPTPQLWGLSSTLLYNTFCIKDLF